MDFILDIDNDRSPDSDFLNHPGLFGITWSKKKAERQRVEKAVASANAKYPTTGTCSQLTSTYDKISNAISGWETSSGGKGHNRVKSRTLDALNSRKKKIEPNLDSACQEEQSLLNTMKQSNISEPEGVNKTAVVLIVGLMMAAGGYGLYKLIKR